jgi:hypothetical protein
MNRLSIHAILTCRSPRPVIDGVPAAIKTRMPIHFSLFLWLSISLWSGCEPADKIPLTSRDTGAVPVDVLMNDSRDVDFVDRSVNTGDTDLIRDADVNCESTTEDCANNTDDDCDGIVDECSAEEVCQGNICIPNNEPVCAHNLECGTHQICSGNQCEPLRPVSCGQASACEGASQCSTVDVCGAEPACRGTAGSSCNQACDCTGRLICRETDERCVQCLHGGQCDDASPCAPNGLCAQSVTLTTTDTESLIPLLLDTLYECLIQANGRTSLGCAQFVWDGDEPNGNQLSPALFSPSSVCILASALPSPKSDLLRRILGCDDATPKVHWTVALSLDANPIGCLSYVPYTNAATSDDGSWQLLIAPCEP